MSADNRNVGLLTSPESVKEHISRLISENEAILEQNPGLLKRRPYHRQVGSQSSVEQETGVRSESNSPGTLERMYQKQNCINCEHQRQIFLLSTIVQILTDMVKQIFSNFLP